MKNIEYYERAAEILEYDPETGKLIRSFKNGRAEEAGTISSRGYIQVSITIDGKQNKLYSHRIIYFIHHGDLPEFLDHIDGDRLNNRIENLRSATKQENNRNSKPRKNSSSKYLGVSWNKARQKWVAEIRINEKKKHLGLFTDEKDAALAYDEAARKYFGEFANPNLR